MISEIFSPKTKAELLATLQQLSAKPFHFGAGYTDLLMDFKQQPDAPETVLNLAQIKDPSFEGIKEQEKGIYIGALTKIARLAENESLKNQFPVLQQAAESLASSQIREVATLGGNLCTASPAGDVSCALVALQSICYLLSAQGSLRKIPIHEFFTGVRKTAMKPDELLQGIFIPANHASKVHSAFIKVGTRRSMECSVISMAYHIQLDDQEKITDAGLAIGSAAPVIRFPEKAKNFLIGKQWKGFSAADADTFAELVAAYADPISDIRATAWYRLVVLKNISRSIFEF